MEDEDVKDGKERIKKEIKGYGQFEDEEDLDNEQSIKLTSEGKVNYSMKKKKKKKLRIVY